MVLGRRRDVLIVFHENELGVASLACTYIISTAYRNISCPQHISRVIQAEELKNDEPPMGHNALDDIEVRW